MTIKQNGGVFGRNPTFNDVTIEGQLTFDGDIDVNSDLKVGGDLEVTKATGDSSPDPVELKLRTQTSASSWSLTDPWGVIDFYSDDTSASGPKSQVQIQAIATNTNGGNSGLDFKLYNTTASQLQSYLKISNGGSNALRHVDITGPGGLYLTGGGNVVMNSGAGIDFSATSDAPGATSELFDDYEEGTWTPVPADALTGGNIATFGVRRGIYTKVGNVVNVFCTITNINTAGLTSGNIFYIQGLPYTPTSYTSPNMFFLGSCSLDNVTFSGSISARVTDNESAISIQKTASGSSLSQLLVSDISSGVGDIYFSLAYEAS